MTVIEAKRLLAQMYAIWPTADHPLETTKVWQETLLHAQYLIAAEAVLNLKSELKWFPSFAEWDAACRAVHEHKRIANTEFVQKAIEGGSRVVEVTDKRAADFGRRYVMSGPLDDLDEADLHLSDADLADEIAAALGKFRAAETPDQRRRWLDRHRALAELESQRIEARPGGHRVPSRAESKRRMSALLARLRP